jgi:hypothetical protein
MIKHEPAARRSQKKERPGYLIAPWHCRRAGHREVAALQDLIRSKAPLLLRQGGVCRYGWGATRTEPIPSPKRGQEAVALGCVMGQASPLVLCSD